MVWIPQASIAQISSKDFIRLWCSGSMHVRTYYHREGLLVGYVLLRPLVHVLKVLDDRMYVSLVI